MSNQIDFFKRKLNDSLTDIEQLANGLSLYVKEVKAKSPQLFDNVEQYTTLIEEASEE